MSTAVERSERTDPTAADADAPRDRWPTRCDGSAANLLIERHSEEVAKRTPPTFANQPSASTTDASIARPRWIKGLARAAVAAVRTRGQQLASYVERRATVRGIHRLSTTELERSSARGRKRGRRGRGTDVLDTGAVLGE